MTHAMSPSLLPSVAIHWCEVAMLLFDLRLEYEEVILWVSLVLATFS